MKSMVALLVTLCMMVMVGLAAVAAQVMDQDKVGGGLPPTGTGSPPAALQLFLFADRTVVKHGQPFHVKVWIESPHLDTATLTLSFSRDQLFFAGDATRPVSLPMSAPLTFAFMGQQAGKSHLLVDVTGRHKSTQETLTARQTIHNIEVMERLFGLRGLLPSPLLGVVLGALLTWGVTWLNRQAQERREQAQRQQWLVTTLPAQLALDRLHVLEKQNTGHEAWLAKLVVDGYYADLQALIAQRSGPTALAQDLLAAGAQHLRNYAEQRAENRLRDEDRERLAETLADLSSRLRKLQGRREGGTRRDAAEAMTNP